MKRPFKCLWCALYGLLMYTSTAIVLVDSRRASSHPSTARALPSARRRSRSLCIMLCCARGKYRSPRRKERVQNSNAFRESRRHQPESTDFRRSRNAKIFSRNTAGTKTSVKSNDFSLSFRFSTQNRFLIPTIVL